MASSVGLKVACIVVMCMVMGAPLAQAITCGQVASSVAPCINYLKTGGPVPPPCCNGVRTLNNAAKTTPDRQATCNCLISAAKGIPGLKPNLVSGLPTACGVNLPFKISTSTNCANIK
ncbi:non-specific lipid-transfer protein 1 [Ziziphus jujuba]|uniref:Non-specific lipid-transfer protein n=1 Tax=Ziziphus jujuba TaxID=326968 RepID=A0A6P6GLS5_ZIZJJ|nr:non-specific lipid-transfer protein 1 [Ziziphus jujuba]